MSQDHGAGLMGRGRDTGLMGQDHGAGLDAVTGAHEHRATLGTEYANELGRQVR